MAKKQIKRRYLNRELSWLEFNQRVLEEARDASLPLLERLKFLAITGSNLDEFFRVRVGGLMQLVEQGVTRPDAAGLSPREQLQRIGTRTRQLVSDQYTCYLDDLRPQLMSAGVQILSFDELTSTQKKLVRIQFETEVFPILSPIAVVDPEDFPLLPNQTLALCVRLRAPEGADQPGHRFAIIPFGPKAPRFLTVSVDSGYASVLLEDVVCAFGDQFFMGEQVEEFVPFRITRNADIHVREDSAADLLDAMEHVLRERRLGGCVRLEIAESASQSTQDFLSSVLGISEASVYRIPGPIDLSAFFRIAGIPGTDDLHYESWPPQDSPDIPAGASLLELVSQRDLLLHHPYESFEPVVQLIEEAADHDDVLAIKQTLYRISKQSPIAEALMKAAQSGKHVTVVVELKARFDEERNISWAKRLEEAGAQVIYGVKGLKTHAKACLIVRRGPNGLERIVHFGTGNYNETTARLYSDISFFTSDADLGADVVAFFNAITGYSQPQRFHKLEAAPLTLRDRLLNLIQVETERARDGLPAKIMVKINSLVDPILIDALYQASQAGVEIKLNIRGICCLCPGVKGLSENIEVISIVDRFLEHARMIYFHHGGDEQVFIASADWMPRNLDRRVELMVPVEDPHYRNRLIDILQVYFQDNVKARRLLADGSHERIKPAPGEQPIRAQQVLYERARAALRNVQQQQRTVFEPHLATDPESPL